MKTRRLLRFSSVALLVAVIAETLYAQPATAQNFLPEFMTKPCSQLSAIQLAQTANLSSIGRFLGANELQDFNGQPKWVAPLITPVGSPRLDQTLRYDQLWQANQNGAATDNFGGGKGLGGTALGGGGGDLLELIPFPKVPNTEVVLGFPAWIAHNGKTQPSPASDGWADETFWFKQRLFCSPPQDRGGDNYIVTALMNFSAPTGTGTNSNRHGIFTPTMAAGKGLQPDGKRWGEFDVQSTLGVSLPSGGLKRLGMPVGWNTAFQWQTNTDLPVILQQLNICPEFEVNYTWWPDGQRKGQTQVFLTPGVIVEHLTLANLALGVGYQVAVTKDRSYNHEVVLSARIPWPKSLLPKDVQDLLPQAR